MYHKNKQISISLALIFPKTTFHSRKMTTTRVYLEPFEVRANTFPSYCNKQHCKAYHDATWGVGYECTLCNQQKEMSRDHVAGKMHRKNLEYFEAVPYFITTDGQVVETEGLRAAGDGTTTTDDPVTDDEFAPVEDLIAVEAEEPAALRNRYPWLVKFRGWGEPDWKCLLCDKGTREGHEEVSQGSIAHKKKFWYTGGDNNDNLGTHNQWIDIFMREKPRDWGVIWSNLADVLRTLWVERLRKEHREVPLFMARY